MSPPNNSLSCPREYRHLSREHSPIYLLYRSSKHGKRSRGRHRRRDDRADVVTIQPPCSKSHIAPHFSPPHRNPHRYICPCRSLVTTMTTTVRPPDMYLNGSTFRTFVASGVTSHWTARLSEATIFSWRHSGGRRSYLPDRKIRH